MPQIMTPHPHVRAFTPEQFAQLQPSAQEYWSRDYGVRIDTSNFGGTSMFHTLPEALDYLHAQYARMRREIQVRGPGPQHSQPWLGFDAWASALYTPDGRIPAALVLMHDGLTSSHPER